MATPVIPKKGELDKLGLVASAFRIPNDRDFFISVNGEVSNDADHIRTSVYAGRRVILAKK